MRSAIWIDPSIPLYFKFDGSRVPDIDREWLARLSASADSSLGLIVTDEEGGPVGALPDLAAAGGPGKARATRAPREH
ncbi:hypothetical protein [Leifsonia virtsii]|uniref:DUF7882 domain-containing protein n=1 Tax=Leifsonia virtsii TaxID=3035915 RepID=A0ABT8J1Y4_9MICO|nr:hypothetical protein [Leifsonia virtsii]MDN4598621.1 hypothetical protein [Leifsonia virtsii]